MIPAFTIYDIGANNGAKRERATNGAPSVRTVRKRPNVADYFLKTWLDHEQRFFTFFI